MPVKSKRDEEKWQKAKDIAKEQGQAENYALIMGIYKKMKPDYFKKAVARIALRYRLAKLSDKDRKEVIDLLASAKGKPLDDDKVHALADKLGMKPHELESEIYAFASLWAINEQAKVNPGGRAEAKGVTRDDFPKATIDKGIKVELEHTKDRELAERIVLDHLAESKLYYDALADMESELEAAKS